jgi:RNA polymerase sigma-70 factor (ECF subfamily)
MEPESRASDSSRPASGRIAVRAVEKDRPTVPDPVRSAQEGDKRAFEVLYRENVGRVFALCLRLVSDERRAEELTQDVFVRAWERLRSFRGEAAFSSWLHRVAVNVVYHSLRADGRRQTREARAIEGREHPSGTGHEFRVDLERAIAALPRRARLVFILHDIEGYPHREIADMTGMAPGTSKAHLHRARRLLRETLSR